MKAKHQRLVLALVAVAAIIGAAFLAMSALKDTAALFRTPTEVAAGTVPTGKPLRLAGMVVPGSIQRDPDGVTIRFVLTDEGATAPVTFRGITPDLFKEGSGAVAEGKLGTDGVFVADNILAKHDERYMPPQMESAMKSEKDKPVTGGAGEARP
ncbi:cytochrome c-type biogenesis protein CcmE [Sphingomonas laterariae]|uniref:Cytochrome c-type biogenesis protein CcmE n=1 Tax=Edaphosphingomonas laterariae TaxID=861865 RepID=A0A239BRW0_9SPHN|nr:cytochrome c maturation protein CcmE [Sphingomonas laterariae]SNS09794.1 cytochrome c-type biogenesis protein CcmE [Sphingomonas laterariae]